MEHGRSRSRNKITKLRNTSCSGKFQFLEAAQKDNFSDTHVGLKIYTNVLAYRMYRVQQLFLESLEMTKACLNINVFRIKISLNQSTVVLLKEASTRY
jgi:hypothetical protein